MITSSSTSWVPSGASLSVIFSGGVHKVKAEVVTADLTVVLLIIPYNNFIKHSVGAKWYLSLSPCPSPLTT